MIERKAKGRARRQAKGCDIMWGRPMTCGDFEDRLRDAGLRPTRQRRALARLLFSGPGCRHVTAEQLHAEAQSAEEAVSLATVYNTLHQFTDAGLLREVVIEQGRSYFDTNTAEHHHFYFIADGRLEDIPAALLQLAATPDAPEGSRIARVDIVLRVAPDDVAG